MRDKDRDVYGLTYRVGRHVGGAAEVIMDLLHQVGLERCVHCRAEHMHIILTPAHACVHGTCTCICAGCICVHAYVQAA